MQLSENARRVVEARYLRCDPPGKLSEAPDQLFARVACAIAQAELLLGNRIQPESLTVPPQESLWLNNEQGLFPGPNGSCQKHQEHPIGLLENRSFD